MWLTVYRLTHNRRWAILSTRAKPPDIFFISTLWDALLPQGHPLYGLFETYRSYSVIYLVGTVRHLRENWGHSFGLPATGPRKGLYQ